MTIRQGFNRLGISVAIAFLGLAVVCLCFAGSNYLQYRSEIARELQQRMQSPAALSGAASPRNVAEVRAKLISSSGWLRFANGRYRSVDQALDLAGLCVLAAIVSFFFWNAIGWFFVWLEPNRLDGKSLPHPTET